MRINHEIHPFRRTQLYHHTFNFYTVLAIVNSHKKRQRGDNGKKAVMKRKPRHDEPFVYYNFMSANIIRYLCKMDKIRNENVSDIIA